MAEGGATPGSVDSAQKGGEIQIGFQSLVELHNNFFYRFQKKNDETQECAYFCRVNARARTENMEKDSKLRLQITAVSHPAKKKDLVYAQDARVR